MGSPFLFFLDALNSLPMAYPAFSYNPNRTDTPNLP